MIEKIITKARDQNKNILIIGSPRSGTHALGAEISKSTNGKLLGEICTTSAPGAYWKEINQLYETPILTIGQLVQLSPKIKLAGEVATIKKHTVVVNIRRRDKVKQFASWIYFRVMDPTYRQPWHNHLATQTRHQQGSIQVSEQQLEQFILEQMVDDFFLPDFQLCYEDLVFTQTKFFKNQFAFPVELIFSNLDFVKEYLANWQYAQGHFYNE